MTPTLRPHQVVALEKVREQFRNGKRAPLMRASTGFGKTVCAGKVAADAIAKGGSVMFVVHRRELIDQTYKTFCDFGLTPSFILGGRGANTENRCQIASVNTLVRRLDQYKCPTLIIVDECHHAVASQWANILSHYKDAKLLGLTATPCRLDGKPLNTFFDALVETPQTAQLIDMGFLTPYDYYAPSTPKLQGLKHNDKDYTDAALSEFSRDTKIIGDNIEQYLRVARGRRGIVFACNVLHSQEIARRYNAAGVPAEHIDGNTNPGERRRILDKFRKGEILVLCNVDLFGEGFDLPAIECVSLLRPTLSTSLYLQQVGRALRTCPEIGKTRAIIFDHVENYKAHGMPDDNRQWSLAAGLVKRNPAKQTEATVKVMRCPECFYAHSPALKCPNCGHEYKSGDSGVKEVAGELVLLGTSEERAAKRREIVMVNSYEELVAISNARGYKLGWAEREWKNKTGEDLFGSLDGLEKVARARKYSNGWAWVQWQRRIHHGS